MPPKHCCCSRTCDVLEDDFNRPDSTDLGPDWLELSGEAEIDNQELHIVSPGITITTARQPPPVRGNNYNLMINVDLIYEPGEEYHIICGFKDVDNFDWVRIYPDGTFDSGQPNYLCSLNRRESGSDTVIMDIGTHPKTGKWLFEDVGEGVFKSHLIICYSTVEWSVEGMRPQQTFWSICEEGGKPELPPNPSHGLIGFIKGRFDNLVYKVHFESDPECPQCRCLCVGNESGTDYSCLPEYLLLTLSPISGFTYCYTDPSPNGGGQEYCCPEPQSQSVLLRQEVPDMPLGPGGGDDIYAENGPLFDCPDYRTATKRVWYSKPVLADDPSQSESPYGIPNANWFALVCDIAGSDVALGIQQYPRLISDSNSGADLLFEVPESRGGPIEHENWQYIQKDISSCNPPILTFGPVQTKDRPSGLCWMFGTRYMITITEAGNQCPQCGSFNTAQC